MNIVETLVEKIRERQAPLRELLGLLGELQELAQPALVTADSLATLERAAANVREAKEAVLQGRGRVEEADREVDKLFDKSGVPPATIAKSQTKLETMRRELAVFERRLNAALRRQNEAVESTRQQLQERHDGLRRVCNELAQEFGQHPSDGQFRYVLDQLVAACDTIARGAMTFNVHVSATEEISDAIARVVERPLPEYGVESGAMLASTS